MSRVSPGLISWEDLRFPLTGRNIDTASGRLDYDYYNGTVSFAANARYNIAETVSFNVQLPHAWREGSELRPHFHWLQQGSDVPNWLMAYKIHKISEASAIETDWSNHTFALSTPVFPYTSGVIEQISTFPAIDMSGCNISDQLHICLWRDSANASTLFADADPSAVAEHIREFDIHYQVNALGSEQEFTRVQK